MIVFDYNVTFLMQNTKNAEKENLDLYFKSRFCFITRRARAEISKGFRSSKKINLLEEKRTTWKKIVLTG